MNYFIIIVCFLLLFAAVALALILRTRSKLSKIEFTTKAQEVEPYIPETPLEEPIISSATKVIIGPLEQPFAEITPFEATNLVQQERLPLTSDQVTRFEALFQPVPNLLSGTLAATRKAFTLAATSN